MSSAKKKKRKYTSLERRIVYLSRKYRPDEILAKLSAVYEEYSAASTSEAEVDYWLKCSRACSNLSSGSNKWLYEMIEERQDEDMEE